MNTSTLVQKRVSGAGFGFLAQISAKAALSAIARASVASYFGSVSISGPRH